MCVFLGVIKTYVTLLSDSLDPRRKFGCFLNSGSHACSQKLDSNVTTISPESNYLDR